MRQGHIFPSIEINFVITDGGIGDYVCYLSSLKYVAEKYPHVRGYLYVPKYFKDLAHNVLSHHKHWVINTRDKFTEKIARSRPLMAPQREPISALGAHPLDLGFIYFVNSMPPPEANFYPELTFHESSSFDAGSEYAVLTPGATDENRAMRSKSFNAIKNFFIKKNIKPVFLGSSKVGDRNILYDSHYDFSGGINLIDKTTLLQAAHIMSKAKVVVGIDNGLLHLAAMTSVPIVFGFTIASPEHRTPRRKKGITSIVHPDVEKLPCTFCQSRMWFITHDFKKCIYKDNECTKELDDERLWISSIEKVIG